jgi:hypothetical protein
MQQVERLFLERGGRRREIDCSKERVREREREDEMKNEDEGKMRSRKERTS